MPLLRVKLYEFILTKNNYPIRRDEDRPYYVPEVPDELYSYYLIDHHFPADRGVLQA